MGEETPPQVNGKKRSRKWVLACVSLAIATAGAVIMEWTAYTLAIREILGGEEWRLVAVGVMYWWMFLDLGILAGYGIPNVVEKWAPGQGAG